MHKTIKTRIVKIGNSQGIRIPKILLDQVGLSGEVEMEAETDRLILRPISRRQNWDAQFQEMAVHGDGNLLDPITQTKWDADEWQW